MNLKKLNKKEAFLDPVHGFIYVEYQVIYDLIHSRELQRLKHVKQLGGTMQVFPTAEHSRFAHSLGTYEMARQIIELSDSLRSYLSEEEKVTVSKMIQFFFFFFHPKRKCDNNIEIIL